MDPLRIKEAREKLGVGPEAGEEALRQAYLKRSFELIRARATQAQKQELRSLFDELSAITPASPTADSGEGEVAPSPAPGYVSYQPSPQSEETREWLDLLNPTSFDSPLVTALAPLIAGAAAVLVTVSPLGFLMTGFHVWVHEFGHATVAWLTGKRAIPLPIGWTNVEFERSFAVYFGALFLLGLLAWAGVRERKPMAVLAAIVIAIAQAYMTWVLPEEPARMAMTFAGVGGEFYLSASLIGLFFFKLPEKFKWGFCRYVFLFLGASSFYSTYIFWKRVKHGLEGIPYGSMVNGEDDAGGDMNILVDDFHWTQHKIIWTYNMLGDVCLLVLLATYAVFTLGLDRALGRAFKAALPQSLLVRLEHPDSQGE